MKADINNILNDCIEAIINGEKTVDECLFLFQEERAELEPMLLTAVRLIEASRVMPDAKKKQQARDRLMAEVDWKRWETGVDRPPVRERFTARVPRLRTAFMRLGVITLVFAMLSGGTLAMAKDSLPGNPLYPLKLAVEKARIGLAGNDNQKAKLHIEAAGKRIEELREVKSNNKNYPKLINAIAENIEASEAATGDDKEVLDSTLNELVKKNEVVLQNVLDKAPEKAKPAIERALNNARNGSHKRNGDKKGPSGDQKIDPKPEVSDEERSLPGVKQPGIIKPKDSKGIAPDIDSGSKESKEGNRTSIPVS